MYLLSIIFKLLKRSFIAMARKEYLSSEARLRFDSPPQLEDVSILLQIPHWAETYLRTIGSATNKVGFILQLGYFRVTARFFVPHRFYESDISLVVEKFKIDPNDIDMNDYTHNRTYYRHQEAILREFGFSSFNAQYNGISHQQALFQEAIRLTALQTKPSLIFDAMVTYLQEKRIETPTYNALRDILTKALDAFSKDLEAIIQNYLTESDKVLLDDLSQKKVNGVQEVSSKNSNYIRYELTFLKRITQSMRPIHIKERLELFVELKTKYQQLQPIIKRLNLSDATIRYFADYVLDTQSSQPLKRVNEYYLQLIAFVIHQYFSLGDALILTLNNAVTSTFNDAEERLKEQHYQNRYINAQLVNQVSRRSTTHIDALGIIESIVENGQTSDTQKVHQIKQLIYQKRVNKLVLEEDQQRLNDLKMVNQPIFERDDYYESLERESIKLQNRVSNIIIELVFDKLTSQKDILQAITFFQQKRGDIVQNSSLPIEFLEMSERQKIFAESGKLRTSLYKVLLFREIKEHIRAGSLNVLSSYEYRSFEEYLIPRSQWNKNKDSFLEKANLTKHKNPAQTLLALNQQLNEQFRITNQSLATNKAVYFDTKGQWHLHRYQAENRRTQLDNTLLYPPNRSISILQVLTQINQLTGFLDAFQHKTSHFTPARPNDNFFYAAIIGFGENIGIPEMAAISRNISKNTLETVANHYFSPEMTLKANDLILIKSNQLPIIEVFRQQKGFVHTGSDGQKYDVSVPSLRAAASFKYFGSGKGINIYSHLDEAGQLIFSTVFSASDKEAHYLLDCLTYNEVVTPDAHSTDSHGFTDPVAAIAGLIDIEFRPRLAALYKRQLYAIDAPWTFKDRNYKILPDAKIDYEHLISQWDEILRMTATIKLRYHKASTLFKRLNSYARKHPLYKAITDLGRIYRTDYTLRYIDQPPLRKSVEGVLSIVEHANNLALAINHGNNQDIIWTFYDDQLKAEGCKRLIMNAINYFNLLILSDKICQCTTNEEKENLIKIIATSSTHTWRHINLMGQYEFSEIKVEPIFDLDKIMANKVTI